MIGSNGGPIQADSELPIKWLGEEEIKQQMFGKRFRGGFVPGLGHMYWSECIDTSGRSVYSSWSTSEQIGQLTTNSSDQACFKYAEEENCFRVGRFDEQVYVFRPLSGRMAEEGIDFWAVQKDLESPTCRTRQSAND